MPACASLQACRKEEFLMNKAAERLYNGIIKEKDIRPEELSSYSFVRLFNAMIKWGALEFSTGTIYG